MADNEKDRGSESPQSTSTIEEVNIPADVSNYSDAEIIDSDWHFELENILSEGFADQGIIKSVCKCRNIPERFRSQVWKICLNVANRGNPISSWDGKYDIITKDQLKTDCTSLITSIVEDDSNSIKNKDEAIDDVMAVIAYYCKCRAVKYNSANGWIDVLCPFVKLGLSRGDLYNCFYAMQSRYISRQDLSPQVSSAPYHLLRLLLLYHDPEMCNYLDTCKISMESFANKWFSTLFSSHCSVEVVSAIWDVYLQQSDSFFMFFLALVILVNAKEQVMETIGTSVEKDEIIKTLESAPTILEVNDVDDFCQLALYYSDRTPSSFRRDLGACFYTCNLPAASSKLDLMVTDLEQSFCLKVSIPELLLSSQPSHAADALGDENGPRIRFFVVDCRPAEFYNKGHLLTAFHLDATLMLREPMEFDAALAALFVAQGQAIEAGSAAGGEHLCFIGSGVKEDDQYMHMVVANLLQKHRIYVSMARGGYASLMDYLSDVGIDLSEWIVGAERSQPSPSKPEGQPKQGGTGPNTRIKMELLVKKMAGNMMVRTKNLREKVVKFIENADDDDEDFEDGDRKARPAKKAEQGVFSIGDESDHSDDDKGPSSSSSPHNVDIEPLVIWKAKPDVKHCFECQAVTSDGKLVAAHLLVTSDSMRCLVEVKGRRGSKQIWVRPRAAKPLCAVVKITSRRSFPELITFKFGDMTDAGKSDQVKIVSADRYILPDAGGSARIIKQLIFEADERRQKEKKPADIKDSASAEEHSDKQSTSSDAAKEAEPS